MRHWFGNLPKSWRTVKMRNVFTERNIKVSDKDYPALSVGYMGVVPQLETAVKTDNGDNRKLICKGDFAINSRSDRKGAGGISNYNGSASLIITVLKPNRDINGNFYHYLLRSYYFSEEFYRNGRGLVSDLWTTNWNNMRNILVPVPPLSEQNQIVRFLDYKVSRIDKLISIRQRQITELEDLKKAIISKAVTKGLNPDVPMKDSGVKWIGDIPAEWEVVKLKRICSMKAGINLVSEHINPSEGAYPVFGGNGVRGYYNEYNIDGDYILIGRQGALCGNIHRTNGKVWATDHAVITNFNDSVNMNYAYYLLIDMNLNQYSSDTAAQPGLSVNVIKNLTTIVPPIAEQAQIAAYLDKKCAQIDSAISNTQRQIAELNDLKARLISDTVTGKIDIRGITIND